MNELPIIDVIQSVFHTPNNDIELIPLKQGMTNNSFVFTIQENRYIIRVPGVNTDKIINRHEEADVYREIKSFQNIEPIIYINPDSGFKITKFIEHSRTVNPHDWADVELCLSALRNFHKQPFTVGHSFDVFEHIEYYESLMEKPSIHQDYLNVKQCVISLRLLIDSMVKEWTLCHIDAVCDNFLITENNDVYLIDFEYAAMQDPDIDIAMFVAYSMFNRHDIDHIIHIYGNGNVERDRRYKIYAYIAMVGLLWSNWCEAKQDDSLIHSEYAAHQYQYAKDFYHIIHTEAKDLLDKCLDGKTI